jgi:hypothetical protein
MLAVSSDEDEPAPIVRSKSYLDPSDAVWCALCNGVHARPQQQHGTRRAQATVPAEGRGDRFPRHGL